jgi:hypothetical protein
MKTITFEGKEYQVEDWVRYVARDSDSYIYGYEHRPELHNQSWEDDVNRNVFHIGWGDNILWYESLKEV